MRIGVMLNNLERDRILAWRIVIEQGFDLVHTNAIRESWLQGEQRELYLTAARAAQQAGVEIHTMFIGFDGQDYSSRQRIAQTVGLLPVGEIRRHRVEIAKAYSSLAAELGVPRLALHLGFMPEDADSYDYSVLLGAVREIADYCADAGQSLLFETGQESAIQLRRFIHAVGRPNLGVNFDFGNFILYGTDDPRTALEVLAPFVVGVHCKNGRRPASPDTLGTETRLNSGEADVQGIVKRLAELGYDGPLVIERECGSDAVAEIIAAREYLRSILPSR